MTVMIPVFFSNISEPFFSHIFWKKKRSVIEESYWRIDPEKNILNFFRKSGTQNVEKSGF